MLPSFTKLVVQPIVSALPTPEIGTWLAAIRPRYARLPRYGTDEKTGAPSTNPRGVRTLLYLVIFGLGVTLLLPLRRTLSRSHFPVHETAEKHLVIASFSAQNVSWLSEIPTSWTIKRYFLDDPAPAAPGLAVPRNQGREAMAYLTYMIDHYDTLPDYMIFTHGHERSWHQVENLQMKVRALNLTALDEENYISLRCGDQMGCERQPYIDTKNPNWGGEKHMCDFWKAVVPHERCPRYVSYKCCAQHAVTRAAVQTRTKEDWIRIREPLLHELTDDKVWGKGATSWLGGMYYEKFWHVLLGQGPEYCPSVERCQQVHFSNAIVCDGDVDLTLFEGDAWKETTCVSAFDGIDKDAPAGPAIEAFHKELLNFYAETRKKAGLRHKQEQEAYHREEAGLPQPG